MYYSPNSSPISLRFRRRKIMTLLLEPVMQGTGEFTDGISRESSFHVERTCLPLLCWGPTSVTWPEALGFTREKSWKQSSRRQRARDIPFRWYGFYPIWYGSIVDGSGYRKWWLEPEVLVTQLLRCLSLLLTVFTVTANLGEMKSWNMLKGCSTSGSRYKEQIINLMVVRKDKLNCRAYFFGVCSSFDSFYLDIIPSKQCLSKRGWSCALRKGAMIFIPRDLPATSHIEKLNPPHRTPFTRPYRTTSPPQLCPQFHWSLYSTFPDFRTLQNCYRE